MEGRFVEIVQALGKTVGLDSLMPDENGYLCLTFDGNALNIEERSGTVFLYTAVAPLPADGKEAVYRRLLEANCFYRETQGATLGIDERLGVLLFYQTPLDALDSARFETILQNFVNTAEMWRTKLAETKSAAGTESPAIGARGGVWA